MNEIINEVKEEVFANVIAKFDPETGDFLGYEKVEGEETLIQTDEDTQGTPETIH